MTAKSGAHRACQHCGKDFEFSPSAESVYCSRACYWAAGRKVLKCPECGKSFTVHKFRNQLCCSMSCRTTYMHRQRRGGASLTEIRICPICHIHFEYSKKQRNPGIYCSTKCMGIAKRLPDTHNARGPNWRKQVKLIRERDRNTCQICGKHVSGRVMKGRFAVHHIRAYRHFNGDWETANQITNLILLCRACHARVHMGHLPCPIPLPI